jgi:hypothetical protein
MAVRAQPTQTKRDALMLHTLVNEYRLTVRGVTFWTPYWINLDKPPFFKGAPHLGKGTPAEIKQDTSEAIKSEPTPPITPQGMRELMTARGIGVDCSAFVYNVLDGWFDWRGLGPLSDYLVVRRDEVLGFWVAHPEAQGSASEASLPEFTKLTTVCREWDRTPRRITNVERLCHPQTANRIERLDRMRPGDMIRLTGPAGDHVGIIVEVLRDRLIWAHSGITLNGVAYEEIRWAKPEADLDEQIWPREVTYQPSNGLDGVWRLKVLDGGR